MPQEMSKPFCIICRGEMLPPIPEEVIKDEESFWAIHKACTALEQTAQTHESTWISVKKSLPESWKSVLVTDGSGYVVGVYDGSFRKWERLPWGFSVTHWMDLPSLPEASKE